MKFQFSEKKVKLPEKVHAYAEKKVMKLARYFEEDAEALIVFSVEKNRNKAELTVHGADHWFRASESTSDMFASIDACVGTIEGQIRKNKTRLARRLKEGAFQRTVQEEVSSRVRVKASWRRRRARRVLFFRIWPSIVPIAASMEANISEVLSLARNQVPAP